MQQNTIQITLQTTIQSTHFFAQKNKNNKNKNKKIKIKLAKKNVSYKPDRSEIIRTNVSSTNGWTSHLSKLVAISCNNRFTH